MLVEMDNLTDWVGHAGSFSQEQLTGLLPVASDTGGETC